MIFLLILLGQTVAGALCRRGLQIVIVAGLFLNILDDVSHIGERSDSEALTFLSRQVDVRSEEVLAGFVHADQADGIEMVVIGGEKFINEFNKVLEDYGK